MRRPAAWNCSPLLAAAALSLAAGTLFAGENDAPDRGVARVSLMNGDVSVRRGDSGDWVAAAVNAPLVVGDSVSTGPGSRAEVQFDYSNMLRLGSDAEVRLSDLQYGRYQLQVARGTVEFRVLRDSKAQVEISTPAVSVRPTRRGAYRITVGNVETEITTRSGEAEIYTPRGVETLRAGRTMLVRGTADQPEYQIVAAISRDEWDQWNERRDRELERATSYRYVSHDIYGAEDLDTYGRWLDTPDYGWVWSPYVGAGWAPYSYGRWAWLDWYGWSWISYDPWGWAPFHYGRWFWGSAGWCWWPGRPFGRAYWSPALVAFFGYGGVGFGFGNVGWVPLAPFEPIYPWWGRRYYGYYGGYRGLHNVNIVNVTNVNITNIYRNARAVNGITAVNAGEFAQGRFTNIMRPSNSQMREVRLARGPMPVAPGSGTLRFSERAVTAMPQTAGHQRFFSHMPPAAVQRVPFAEQQRSLARLGGNPAAPAAGAPAAAVQNSFRGGSGAPVSAAPGAPASAGHGWRGFGEPGRAPAAAPSMAAPAQPGASGGWRRFGEPGPAGTPRSEAPENRTETAPGGGWRNFGAPRTAEPGNRPAQRFDTAPAPRESQGGWQRFENTPSPQRNFGRANGGFDRPGRIESAPRQLQIAPPVVRERSMPRSEAPAMRSAPAPRSSGGGGGGGARSYGGGGGGSRPSGGGGSRGGGRGR